MHGKRDKLIPAHGKVGLEVVRPAHTLADEHALLRQPERGAISGHPVHVGIGHLCVGLFDFDLDGGGGGGVTYGVHSHIGEGVLAGLVFVGRVDEFGRTVL